MSTTKRPWWRAFDKVERKLGRPLEDAVGSSTYMDVMVRGMKVQRAIGGAVRSVAGGATSKLLHAVNIPTRSDLQGVNKQLTTLTREVRGVVTAQQQATPPAKAKPKPKAAAPAKATAPAKKAATPAKARASAKAAPKRKSPPRPRKVDRAP